MLRDIGTEKDLVGKKMPPALPRRSPWVLILAGMFMLTLLSSPFGQTQDQSQQDGGVHITVFTTPECPECAYVKQNIIPELQRRYGTILVVSYVNAADQDNYALLEALEHQYGDTDNDFPVIFCGNEVLGGRQEVEENLGETVQECLHRQGCPPAQLREEPEKPQAHLENTVYLAYFYSSGCKKCGRAEHMLLALQRRYPNLTVREYDLSLEENKILAEAMGRRCGLSEHRRLVAPSLFFGQDALVGDEIREARVRALVEEYQAVAGGEPIWEMVAADTSQAARGIVQRFQTLSVMTVIAGGLIDGINPCAFATIIFFISYLAFVGRQKREVLLVGISFTMAVFLTYLAIGLGLFHFLRGLAFLNLLSQIIYGLAAALVFVLGLVSLYDYHLIRSGHKPSELKLQLPLFLKRRIHSTIRERSRSGHLMVGAVGSGVIISVLELACTGQVYLPTIVFVMGVSELKSHAFFYLLIYNLLFVFPLALIFLVSYMGVTSKQMSALLETHLDKVKLVLGLFFLFLCGFLVYILLH